MPHLIWFILLSLLAEILGTVGGFGSSMFFVPVAGYFLDFHAVLGITAIFHLSSNITKILFFNKGFNKKLVLQLGIPAVVFVILGAYLSKFLDTKILELVLAIFLILLSSILLLFKNLSLKPTTTNSVVGGALSGITAGILGTGGAIRGLTLAAFGLSTEVFIATSAIIDLGIDASRSAVYIYNGFVKWEDLYLIPILLVVSIIGTYVGKKILAHINEQQFKIIVLMLIMATGLLSLYKFATG